MITLKQIEEQIFENTVWDSTIHNAMVEANSAGARITMLKKSGKSRIEYYNKAERREYARIIKGFIK